MPEKIKVQSALPQQADGGFPLAIYERNPVHEPDGELYIADDQTHTVVATAEVARAINDGRLTTTISDAKLDKVMESAGGGAPDNAATSDPKAATNPTK